MWQAVKNVATYGGALMLIIGAIFVVSNIACCGAIGTVGVIGTQIDEVGTGEEVKPTP